MKNRLTPSTDRRGTIYIAVLGVTLMVAVMAAVGMSIARLERRVADAHDSHQRARLLAHAGVEYSVNWLEANSNWRTALINTKEIWPPFSLGSGTFTALVRDPDGSLSDNDYDGVEVVGYGQVGEARAGEAVELRPRIPLTCLEAAVHTQKTINLPAGNVSSTTRIQSNQIVSSNDDIDSAANTEINADVEAVDEIRGTGNITGTRTPNHYSRDMPDPTKVFDFYRERGTWIAIESLPTSGGGDRRINRRLLSPASNPFGATNREGIYVIDCQGQNVRIDESRIVGTLVLLNTGINSRITGVVNMAPAVANYPALLVEGDMELNTTSSLGLSEGTSLVNFNPPGTPYQDPSNFDGDTDDYYPSIINGLAYVSGRATVTGNTNLSGCLIADELLVNSGKQFTADYNNLHHSFPPPGFARGWQMRIVPGTWRRVPAAN